MFDETTPEENRRSLQEADALLTEIEATTLKKRAADAASHMSAAAKRGAQGAVSYWKKVRDNALRNLKKKGGDAGAKDEPTGGSTAKADEPTKDEPKSAKADEPSDSKDAPDLKWGDEPSKDEPKSAKDVPADDEVPRGPGFNPAAGGVGTPVPPSEKDKADDEKPDDEKSDAEPEKDTSGDEKGADGEEPDSEDSSVDPDAEGIDVEGMTEEEAALVQSAAYRKKAGKKIADGIDDALDSDDDEPDKDGVQQPGGLLGLLGSVVGGVTGALGAIGRSLAGVVTGADSKTLGKASGALVLAMLGGAAFGGIGALAGLALAQYFASKSADRESSDRLRALQRDLLVLEQAGDKATDVQVRDWCRGVIQSVRDGFRQLGDMPPDEVAAIIRAAKANKASILKAPK